MAYHTNEANESLRTVGDAHDQELKRQMTASNAAGHDDDMPLKVTHGGPAERGGPVAAQMPRHTNVLQEPHDHD